MTNHWANMGFTWSEWVRRPRFVEIPNPWCQSNYFINTRSPAKGLEIGPLPGGNKMSKLPYGANRMECHATADRASWPLVILGGASDPILRLGCEGSYGLSGDQDLPVLTPEKALKIAQKHKLTQEEYRLVTEVIEDVAARYDIKWEALPLEPKKRPWDMRIITSNGFNISTHRDSGYTLNPGGRLYHPNIGAPPHVSLATWATDGTVPADYPEMKVRLVHIDPIGAFIEHIEPIPRG